MSLGSLRDHFETASSKPAHIDWVADPDISGIGVVLYFAVTAALSLILLVVSFLGSYRGHSVSRLTGCQAFFQRLGMGLLDQLAMTTLAMAVSFLVSWPSLSAFSRNLIQLCISLSNISALILISTRSIGVRQVLMVAATSLGSFGISLHNAFDKASVSAELAWLESGMDQVIDDRPLLEIPNSIIGELACLFAIFLTFGYCKGGGRIGKLGWLIISISMILLNFAAIRDLYKRYEPYVNNNDRMWSFGQVLPLALLLLVILCSFKEYTSAPRVKQHPEREVEEDIPATSLGLIPSRIWFTRANKIAPGYRRISWKCSCGETLAANFDNSDPQALEALERRLHGLGNPGVARGHQQGPAIPATSRSGSGSTGQGTFSTSQGSTRQPSTSSGKGSSANASGLSRRNATSSNNSQKAGIPRYFELCVSVGQLSVSLVEINISSVATDSQLFSKIWESYHGIKKSSFRAAIRDWFFKPDDVFFVHFGVTKRHQVGIYGKPMEIPPPEEVYQGLYHYSQCPMQPLPPMPDHIFLHYLDRARRTTRSEKNPQAHAEDIFLNRLPKKLGSSIFTTGTGVDATILYGWGVHIVERPSVLAQSMVGIASALICIIIFGITCAFAGLGTAIGIGQFAAGVLTLSNAAIYFALQAYSSRLSRRTP